METKVWGPGAWIFLHSITMNYPENPTNKQKKDYYNFFSNIGNVLPCVICNEHYKKHLNELPINLNSRKEFVHWLVKIHNRVNRIHNKKEFTYEEAMKYFEELYSEGFSNNIIKTNKFLTLQKIIISLLLSLAVFYLVKKYTKLL